MVLPGVRGDQRTPGGMPDSGSVNPGGPVPSVPQGTRQPNMGAGVGEPDPKKIEEMFTQYTTGQITRDDLLNFLHGESEGRGGILGLLEGMQQPEGSGAMPQPASALPGSANGNGGAISPGAASVAIPPIKEPLDARHQKISTMLQGYGLGPADADQLSTILNPHIPGKPTQGHYGAGDEDEGGAFGPSAVETTQTVGVNPNLAGRREEWVASKTPDLSDEGGAWSPSATETVQTANVIPNLAGQREDWVASQIPDVEQEGGAFGPSATETQATPAVKPVIPVSAGAVDDQAQAATTISARPSGLDAPRSTVVPTAIPEAAAAPVPEDVIKHGDPNPNGDGSTWDADKGDFVFPPSDVIAATGNLHPSLSGMPAGYGGGGWGYDIGSSFLAGTTGMPTGGFKGGIPDWGKKPWIDEKTGIGWPDEGAFRQFYSDMRLAFRDSVGFIGEGHGRAPVVHTAQGRQAVQFMGWVNGEPTFGLPGMGSMNISGGGDFVPVEEADGSFYWFSDRAAAELFAETGELPDGGTLHRGGTQVGTITGGKGDAAPTNVVSPGDKLPDGYKWADDGSGTMVPINPATGDIGTDNGDGTFSVTPPIAAAAPAPTDAAPAAATGETGFGPTMTDLDLKGAGNFPMMNDFLQQLELGNIGGDAAGASLTASLAAAITTLEVQKSKGDVAADQRMADVVMNSLDRTAVTARADADRQLQAGAAIGEINKTKTLAAKAEQNKAILEQSKISGFIQTMGNDGNLIAGSEEGLEARVVTMTETEKTNQRNQNMAQLFGTWLPGADPTSQMETIEKQKFGLTKAITQAEISGQIPEGYGTGKTLAAKRMAWEQDVARQNANTQTQLARNGVRRNEIDLQIAQNKINSDQFIAGGQLAEAVETRKDATFLAKQKLDIEREKMKLDTLTALANPATYLFAVRYGLLEQIGGTLGISWGDDAITSADLPRMVEPGTFPSMTDFQNATPTEREIMLAEVASSGGFTTDEAVRMIMEGAPGGRDIRRTSLIGVSR